MISAKNGSAANWHRWDGGKGRTRVGGRICKGSQQEHGIYRLVRNIISLNRYKHKNKIVFNLFCIIILAYSEINTNLILQYYLYNYMLLTNEKYCILIDRFLYVLILYSFIRCSESLINRWSLTYNMLFYLCVGSHRKYEIKFRSVIVKISGLVMKYLDEQEALKRNDIKNYIYSARYWKWKY